MSGILAHQVDGSGEPVVLLNGGMMSFASWDPIALALAKKQRVVRCDFRGQLRSPGLPAGGFEGHADDVAALLDHLGIASAHVVGASYGALAGLHLCARHPSRVRSFAAVTVVDRTTPGMHAEMRKLQALCRAALAGGPREPVYDLIAATAYSPAWMRDHAEELAARRRLVSALPAAWFEGLVALLEPLLAFDATALLPSISIPTLVVIAEHDAAMPRERSEAVAAKIPGAERTFVAGSGHAVIVEREAETVAILEGFLARHKERP